MRHLAAWSLYWLGDLVSRLHHLFPDDWRIHALIYVPYNRLMVASYRVQGDGRGPWT